MYKAPCPHHPTYYIQFMGEYVSSVFPQSQIILKQIIGIISLDI